MDSYFYNFEKTMLASKFPVFSKNIANIEKIQEENVFINFTLAMQISLK